MRFGGIQKTSLIDFPDKIATVLFTPGCNLRCPYCHNWRLILDPPGPFLSEKEALQVLEDRRRFVDAVVFPVAKVAFDVAFWSHRQMHPAVVPLGL